MASEVQDRIRYDQPVLLGLSFPSVENVWKKKKKRACIDLGASCRGRDCYYYATESYLIVSKSNPIAGNLDESGILTFRKASNDISVYCSERDQVQIFTNYGHGPCLLGIERGSFDKIGWISVKEDSKSNDLLWSLRRVDEGRGREEKILRGGDSLRFECSHTTSKKKQFLSICSRTRRVQLVSDIRRAAVITISEPSMRFIVTWKARLALELCHNESIQFRKRKQSTLFTSPNLANGQAWLIFIPSEVKKKIVTFLASELIIHTTAVHDTHTNDDRLSWSSVDDYGRSYRRSHASLIDIRNIRATCKNFSRAAEDAIISIRIGELDHFPRRTQRFMLISLAARCPRLIQLKLRNLDSLRDIDLDPLASVNLPLLQVINLGGCVRITDSALDRLASLSSLTVLNLANTAITAEALAEACARFWPRLEDLNIYGKSDFIRHLPVEGKHDHRATSLKTPGDVIFILLRSCPNLRSLNARDAGFCDSDVAHALSRLSSVSSLDSSSVSSVDKLNSCLSILVDNRSSVQNQYQRAAVYNSLPYL